MKAVRSGKHHHNVINFLKLKVYNIDVINFALNRVFHILLYGRWCDCFDNKHILLWVVLAMQQVSGKKTLDPSLYKISESLKR